MTNNHLVRMIRRFKTFNDFKVRLCFTCNLAAICEVKMNVLLISGRVRNSGCSLVRYVILAISFAKIDFIVFMASLGVK